MSRPTPAPADTDDAWAIDFFTGMLEGRLDSAAFEAAVLQRWQGGRFIGRAPRCADWLRGVALQQSIDAGYGTGSGLGFRSQWLLGESGRPGVIHIQAPAERTASPRLQDKNRAPHMHDSGRVSLITQGRAVLHVARSGADGEPLGIDCPVQAGDLLFWPAWTAHTFDALDGFWMISAMGTWVSPAEDGFVIEPEAGAPRLDEVPRHDYAQYLRERSGAR